METNYSTIDWDGLRRQDFATTVDYLTSIAGAFHQLGLFDQKRVTELRVQLADYQTHLQRRGENSLLLMMEHENAPLLHMLFNRYGVSGFYLNFIRHACRYQMGLLRHQLATFGDDLTSKTRLVFNRPLAIFVDGQPDRTELFSGILAEVADRIAAAMAITGDIENEMGAMLTHKLASEFEDDAEFDTKIATAVGFAELDPTILPGTREPYWMTKLQCEIGSVANLVETSARQIGANQPGAGGIECAYSASQLQHELQRLGSTSFAVSHSVLSWEVRRKHILHCFVAIRHYLERLQELFIGDVARYAGQVTTDTRLALPRAVERRLITTLTDKQVDHSTAKDAVGHLERYLEDKAITAREMLPGELGQAHKALLPKTLATMQKLTASPNIVVDQAEKKALTASRLEKLAEVFKTAVGTSTNLLLVLALGGLMPGCGLKTKVKSDVIEPRPDIPYRGVPPKTDDPNG